MTEIRLPRTNEHIETERTYLTREDILKLVIDDNDAKEI